MTHPTASLNYSERQAGSLRTGDLLLLPDAERTAEIQRVDVDTDDFGSPAIVRATLTGGGVLRIAAGSVVLVRDAATVVIGGLPRGDRRRRLAGRGSRDGCRRTRLSCSAGRRRPELQLVQPRTAEDGSPTAAAAVVVPPLPAAPPAASGPSEADLALIPAAEGTPESVVEAAAEAHPDALGVLLLSDRLAKGINTKSGSCLKDLSDLAHELFVALKDADNALAVADLLNVLPFDGNPGRWASVEASLALASYICRQRGEDERAAVYEKFLRAPDARKRTRSRPGSTPRSASARSTSRTCTTRKSSAPSTTPTTTPNVNGGCCGWRRCCSCAPTAVRRPSAAPNWSAGSATNLSPSAPDRRPRHASRPRRLAGVRPYPGTAGSCKFGPMTNNLSVVINADAQQVWTMLREPAKVAQWHGWEADDLAAEINEIYFGPNVVESADHTCLIVDGGDIFALKPVPAGTGGQRDPRRAGPQLRVGGLGRGHHPGLADVPAAAPLRAGAPPARQPADAVLLGARAPRAPRSTSWAWRMSRPPASRIRSPWPPARRSPGRSGSGATTRWASRSTTTPSTATAW